MVIDVIVKVPDADADDMTFVHKAARRLSKLTASGNVELRETKTFKPLDEDGDGGTNWETYSVEASCSSRAFDESKIRAIHQMLVNNISVPEEVAIETKVTDKGIHLVG